MGNCNLRAEEESSTVSTLNKSLFEYKYAIGRGGFGKVWRVSSNRLKGEKLTQFAMKEMLKARVMHKKSVQSVMNELKLLSVLQSKFIVNAHYAFQDSENLYLVMDLLLGGDLRFHLARQKRFSQAQTKFFCACLVQALETVHGANIIHRDIKPENLVFDENGYLKLTDFGIAREWIQDIDNSNETSGTPGYMAPEVMCKNNHGIAADYFAIGVIAWECMFGRRPYVGKTRREIRDDILSKQQKVSKASLPDGWSEEAADFINQCLCRKANKRLGYNGNHEAKKHAWFEDFDWNGLIEGTLRAPYLPSPNQVNFDENHVNNQEWKDAEAVKENMDIVMNPTTQQLFKGYYFDKNHQNTQGGSGPSGAAVTKSTTGGNNQTADTDGGAANPGIRNQNSIKTQQKMPYSQYQQQLNGTPSFNRDDASKQRAEDI